MTLPRRPLRSARPARGVVTVVTMLFLIATVVFSLGLLLVNSSGAVVDGQRQADSTAAFFIAESGLEKAQASVQGALGASYTNANCTGVGVTTAIGRGSVTTTAVSGPASCSLTGTPACTACTVTSTGTVGTATRTLTQDIALATVSGTSCNHLSRDCDNDPDVVWRLRLQNTSPYTGVAVFALAYDERGNNRATCAAASNCRLEVDVTSPAAGTNSIGHMTNAVTIPAGSTYPIYQTTTKNNDVVEVGALFYGSTAAPTLAGVNPTSLGGAAFWDSRSRTGGQSTLTPTTGRNNETTGGTSDGTATSTGTCTAPSAVSNGYQACTSWCQGGDTLVFSVSARVQAFTDQFTGVTFGTNAGVGQNLAMTRVIKYPTAGAGGAPNGVDAEIWYARNPNLAGTSPTAANVSSYKGHGTAGVGSTWSSNGTDTTAISAATLTVGDSFGSTTAYPNQVISVGDTVSVSGGGGTAPTCSTDCGTVTAQITTTEAFGALGGRGTYQLSASNTAAARNGRSWTLKSNVLRVTGCTTCFFASGDALAGVVAGRTVSSTQLTPATLGGLVETAGGIGRYPIGGAAVWVAPGSVKAGTPGATLYLPAAEPGQPAVTTPPTIVALRAGTGTIVPNTSVAAVAAPNTATKSFTVSTAPTTPLENATVCGGTCAMFVPGGSTYFSLQGLGAVNGGWAGGFVCLKGVDVTPQIVTTVVPAPGRWTEVVQ